MSRIRGENTTPEKIVRSILHRLGYRFRLHARMPVAVEPAVLSGPSSPGRLRGALRTARPTFVRPDILLPKHKTAIFVHGCFWHRHRGCKNCTTPTHRRRWWLNKLEGNAARDRLQQRALRKAGWKTVVVWECETERPESLKKLAARICKIL